MKVVIVGGGWAGSGAAMAAKNAGADEVVVLERTDMLLGTGLVGGIMRNNGRFTATEEAIAMGANEIFETIDAHCRHKNINFPGHEHASLYDIALIETAIRTMLINKGVEVKLQARMKDVKMDGQKIAAVVLTDGDLFPPGTVTLGGLKVFGEESGRVISYAATMAHASESGLSRLFDNLLASDGGFREQVEDVDFYEEGGVGGRIHGETVLFGTAGFMRKRGVNLPRNLGLKTGVFLSVDGTLIAVFAVKYMPAENVDWALHALHHSRITPVLAVRDGNITPALLKRKFGTDARAVYPKLSTRLALSERGGGRPYALLMREGLMPYAEVVLGSKRLCASAKRCTVLAFLAATASTLLAFYLTFVGAYSVLTPLSLLIYVLLWSLSALVDALLSDRY